MASSHQAWTWTTSSTRLRMVSLISVLAETGKRRWLLTVTSGLIWMASFSEGQAFSCMYSSLVMVRSTFSIQIQWRRSATARLRIRLSERANVGLPEDLLEPRKPLVADDLLVDQDLHHLLVDLAEDLPEVELGVVVLEGHHFLEPRGVGPFVVRLLGELLVVRLVQGLDVGAHPGLVDLLRVGHQGADVQVVAAVELLLLVHQVLVVHAVEPVYRVPATAPSRHRGLVARLLLLHPAPDELQAPHRRVVVHWADRYAMLLQLADPADNPCLRVELAVVLLVAELFAVEPTGVLEQGLELGEGQDVALADAVHPRGQELPAVEEGAEAEDDGVLRGGLPLDDDDFGVKLLEEEVGDSAFDDNDELVRLVLFADDFVAVVDLGPQPLRQLALHVPRKLVQEVDALQHALGELGRDLAAQAHLQALQDLLLVYEAELLLRDDCVLDRVEDLVAQTEVELLALAVEEAVESLHLLDQFRALLVDGAEHVADGVDVVDVDDAADELAKGDEDGLVGVGRSDVPEAHCHRGGHAPVDGPDELVPPGVLVDLEFGHPGLGRVDDRHRSVHDCHVQRDQQVEENQGGQLPQFFGLGGDDRALQVLHRVEQLPVLQEEKGDRCVVEGDAEQLQDQDGYLRREVRREVPELDLEEFGDREALVLPEDVEADHDLGQTAGREDQLHREHQSLHDPEVLVADEEGRKEALHEVQHKEIDRKDPHGDGCVAESVLHLLALLGYLLPEVDQSRRSVPRGHAALEVADEPAHEGVDPELGSHALPPVAAGLQLVAHVAGLSPQGGSLALELLLALHPELTHSHYFHIQQRLDCLGATDSTRPETNNWEVYLGALNRRKLGRIQIYKRLHLIFAGSASAARLSSTTSSPC